MTITKNKPKQKTIKLGKDVTAARADSLKKKLFETMGQGINKLNIDFANVKAVDPVGLSVIIATHNSLQNFEAQLTLKNVSEQIYHLFHGLGLDQHFEVNVVE